MGPVTTGAATPRRVGPPGWCRATLGVVAGAVASLIVVRTLGLGTGRPIGVEDNGDGHRLFCGTGMVPRTVDGLAAWKAGVVTDFAVGEPTCGLSMPSSAALVLRVAALGGDGSLTLAGVAWWYAALVGVVVAVAAWAASASGPWRAVVLLVPVAPLALAPFTRFFVSTYAEPAGLLGALAVACGVAALMVVDPGQRQARAVALGLTVLGGAVAATAKVAYLPVLVAALAVVAVLWWTGDRPRTVGWAATVVTVIAVAVPVGGAVHFQDQVYEGANVHDVVFTLALVELGPGATARLGLPPEAAAVTGNGYFNGPPLPVAAWWDRAIREQPDATRSAALASLAREPRAALRAIGVGLQATTRADLAYLASGPADPARLTSAAGDPGWSGARGPEFRSVLDGTRRPPWFPTALVLLAIAAAVSSLSWRRRAPAAARWCRAAGLGAVTALGLVVITLLGDGYFEVFKHVWLAAYVLVVTGLCLVGALGAGAARMVRAQHRPG